MTEDFTGKWKTKGSRKNPSYVPANILQAKNCGIKGGSAMFTKRK